MIARVATVAVGLWLMAAPAVLGYAGTAAGSSDRIVGPLAASVGIVSIWAIARGLRWLAVPLGLWAMAGPVALGGSAAAVVNGVVCGALLIALAPIRGPVRERYGGGWRSLIGGWGSRT